MTEIIKRKEKLQKLGGFRILKDKTGGLRRRVDASIWSKRVHIVTSFPREATVTNEDGETSKTKGVLAVTIDSSAVAEAPSTVSDNLRGYAVKPDTFPNAAKVLRREKPGLEAALRAAGLTTTAFLDMFKDLFTRNKRTITARDQPPTPPEAEQARPRRRLNIVM